jgi:hypothetical protein
MERRISLLRYCILPIVALLLFAASSAQATTGDYTVAIPGTDGIPGWTGYRSGGPYQLADGYIGTAIGTYASGSYEIRRLHVPDATLRILGGNMAGRISSPQNGFVARVRVGSEGGAIRTLLDTANSQMFDTALAGDNSWVDFGLYTTAPVTTTAVNANYIDMRTLNVTVRDVADPALTVNRPDASQWFGDQCVWIASTARDSGSGIRSLSVTNETSGVGVANWAEPTRAGLAPGNPAVGHGACVTKAQSLHGLNSIRVDTSDASGRTSSDWMNVRFDFVPPSITPTVASGAQFTNGHPAIAFDIADADSGLTSSAFTIDGVPAAATVDRNRSTVTLGSGLAVGRHTFAASAVDRVGNSRSASIAITIVDVTPPTLTVAAPGGSGGPEPWLDASAADSQSTIDATSWTVAVDGQTTPLPAATARLHAPLGMLAAGVHSIALSVADAHGNRTSVTREYVVNQVDAASAAAALGGTTALRLGGPASGTVRYGLPIRLVVVGARNGRPLSGDRFLARINGALVAEAIADAHGVGALTFTATRSGRIAIDLADGSIAGTGYTLHVAPRITLAAASKQPKRGKAVVITGGVRPLLRGRTVRIEARIENSWYPLRRTVKLDRKGRFRTTVRSAVPGQIAVRVRLKAQGQAWAAASSNVVLLRVRR